MTGKANGRPHDKAAVQSKASAGSRGASSLSLVPTEQTGNGSGPYLTVAQTAELLGVSEWRCYELLKAGIVPHARTGAKGDAYLLHRGEIERYVREGRPVVREVTPDAPLPTDALAEQVLDRVLELVLAARREVRRG